MQAKRSLRTERLLCTHDLEEVGQDLPDTPSVLSCGFADSISLGRWPKVMKIKPHSGFKLNFELFAYPELTLIKLLTPEFENW